jgi:hypothetical protein
MDKELRPFGATEARPPSSPSARPDSGSSDDAGKNMAVGCATLAAGLIRANLVVEFADSLSNVIKVIKEKSVHASDLKDRRAVQEAYAGSVATVNRLGKEAGCCAPNCRASPESTG